MQKGDKVKIKAVSGSSNYFTIGACYTAEIITDMPDGDHSMWVIDDEGANTRVTMFNTRHLNGGSFKIVLEGI